MSCQQIIIFIVKLQTDDWKDFHVYFKKWQRGRFEEQIRQHNEKRGVAVSGTDAIDGSQKKDEDDSYEVTLDDDFLTALEYGMPPASGLVLLSFLCPLYFITFWMTSLNETAIETLACSFL